MQEELITFETAKLAKEKGFDVPTWDYFQITCAKEPSECCTPVRSDWNKYDDYKVFSRPTQSLLQKWLREVHKICIDLNVSHYNYKENCCYFYGITMFGERIPTTNKCDKEKIFLRKGHFQSYEEALEIGLQEGLKLIKS